MDRKLSTVEPGLDKSNEMSYHHPRKPGTEGDDSTAVIRLDRLLTTQEVCELLRVKKSYVYSLTHQKKIPHIKIQGHLRFWESEIVEWLKSQEVRCNVGLQEES